ncbi:transposase [Ensifer sp. 4252]
MHSQAVSVPIKSAEKQASSMTFKVRDLLVRQRTQTINALRGHLMEYGLVAAQGMQNVPRLRQMIETHPDLPEIARSLSFGLLQHIDFAAWIGLTPKQNSSGGKERLGKTSKMGQRDLRRLLIIGATTVVRWARRRGAPAGTWLARMLLTKPPKLIAVALANKLARIAWALMARGGVYEAPAPGSA